MWRDKAAKIQASEKASREWARLVEVARAPRRFTPPLDGLDFEGLRGVAAMGAVSGLKRAGGHKDPWYGPGSDGNGHASDALAGCSRYMGYWYGPTSAATIAWEWIRSGTINTDLLASIPRPTAGPAASAFERLGDAEPLTATEASAWSRWRRFAFARPSEIL